MGIPIREAVPADNQILQAVQARCPMGASLVVSTVNTPDFFGRARAYAWSRVYIAGQEEEVAGSAACALRHVLVNGQVLPVGYEFQYFVAPEHRHRGIAAALHDHIAARLIEEGAALSYLIVIEGNEPALQLFTGLGFRHLRSLLMPGILVYKKMDLGLAAGQVRPARPGDLAAIAALANETWQGHQLYEPVSAGSLQQFVQRTPAYELDNLFVLERGGEIQAALGYWDWSRITRLTVQAVSTRLRLIGLGLDLLGRVRTMPSSVHAGNTLRQVVLTPVAFREPADLGVLVDHVNNLCLAAGIGQIFAACEPGHVLLQSLKGLIRIDTAAHLLVKPLQPDLSLEPGPAYLDGQDL